MIRILQGTQLTLQQDGLALLQGLLKELAGVAEVRTDQVPVLMHGGQQLIVLQLRLVIEVPQLNVLDLDDPLQMLLQGLLVKELVDLKANLCKFIGEEGSDAGLGGSEGSLSEALLLILIKEDMVGHDDLHPVGHQDLRLGNASLLHCLQLLDKGRDGQSHTVSDHTGGVLIENAAGQQVKRKSAVIIDDGVTGIGTALIADDDV